MARERPSGPAVWRSSRLLKVPATPKESAVKRMSSRAPVVRGDWRRRRTQTASRREVLPWALSPVKTVMPSDSGQLREW